MLKLFFIILYSFCFIGLNAQIKLRKFFIRGEVIGSLNISHINIASRYKNSNVFILKGDSIPVHRGRFSVRGRLAYPQAIHMFHNDDVNYFSTKLFFIDKGRQQLLINTDSADILVPAVKGSRTHSFFVRHYYSSTLQESERRLNRFADTVQVTEMNRAIYAEMKKQRNELRDSLLLVNSRKNPNGYITSWLLLDYLSKTGYSPTMDVIYSTLDSDFKSSMLAKYLEQSLYNSSVTAVGRKFPKVQVFELNLNKFERFLHDTSSKFTLIDFWFAKCGPCIAQFPALSSLYERFGGRNFEIVNISIDKEDDVPFLRETIGKQRLSWLQLVDPGGVEASRMQINSYPTNFLLDKEGRVLFKNIDLELLERILTMSLFQ